MKTRKTHVSGKIKTAIKQAKDVLAGDLICFITPWIEAPQPVYIVINLYSLGTNVRVQTLPSSPFAWFHEDEKLDVVARRR